MKRIKHILVAHDFSEGSHLALDYGIELAVENYAELHFLHVEVLHAETSQLKKQNKTKAQVLREKLRADILDSLKKQNLLYTDLKAISYKVMHEIAAAPAIIEYSNDNKIDMIVLGTHGRRGLRRKLLGSVAEEVVRLAPCAVFTVREQAKFSSLDENLGLITVPVDFSDDSRVALEHAKDLASSFGAQIEMVHVIEDRFHPIFYSAGVSSIYDMHPEIESSTLNELEVMFDSTKGPEAAVKYTVLSGHPVDEIINHVEKTKSDLIIIATHGLSGLDRAIMGSVTSKIVRFSPCPVITVKGSKEADIKEAEMTEGTVSSGA